jgi:hypothetical protein
LIARRESARVVDFGNSAANSAKVWDALGPASQAQWVYSKNLAQFANSHPCFG